MALAISHHHRSRLDPVNPTLDGTPVSLGTTSTHDAFPGVCRLATGDQHLICVYRQASDHGTTFDGILRKRTSTDNGATWSAATTIWDPTPDSAGGCNIVRLANDDLLVTTWKKLNGVSDWQAVSLLSTDDGATWGSPVNITSAFTDFSLCESPATQLANGDLYVPLYGQNSGDAFESVRMSKSTNGGASWTDFSLIATGSTRDWQEPCLVVLGNGVWLCMIRSDATRDEIHFSQSVDQGVTWSTPRGVIGGDGRPAVYQRASDGVIVCTYREPFAVDDLRFRTSNDSGRTWSRSAGDFTNSSNLFGTYAQFVTLNTGQVAVVYSLQAAGGDVDASLWFSKITGGS